MFSLLQPDAIATLLVGGVTYFVTANEGDARVGTGLTGEEVRLSSAGYDLDDTVFPNEADLKNNDDIGRLNVINHEGDTDGDGDIDEITTYGGRGISIFRRTTTARITRCARPAASSRRSSATCRTRNLFFNSENTFGHASTPAPTTRGRSRKASTVQAINGRTYAFVTLERAGGVMIYDVTDPANASFVSYEPPLPFSAVHAGSGRQRAGDDD